MTPDHLRILIADDIPAIHEDYRKILTHLPATMTLVQGVADFAQHFTRPAPVAATKPFLVESVLQGEDAIRSVVQARDEGRPYALIFLDVRMPPGIDGVETAQRLRQLDPDLQIVLCTAYSDYSFSEISRRFQESDGLLILKKPFDPAEVQQIAHALCRKWTLAKENRALIADLEQRVLTRTAELKVALTRAEAANNTKSEFLRCIGHEINTPLNGIMGAASVIELSSDPESVEMGRLMLESAERLNRLFSRILLYLKIDETPALGDHYINLTAIADKISAEYQPVATAKNIHLILEQSCPRTLRFDGAPHLLSEALINLVENAIKFTDKGQVIVRFLQNDTATFTATVEDTGPGLDATQSAQLYKLFGPGDLSLARRHQGVGIGLTLAKRVAEHFGGCLSHRNRDPKGSIFTLSLPCRFP
jgi:signal transduction histidine kinase